jgi:hypothetical protein
MAQQPGKSYNDVLIDHAHLLWNSECENARGIAARIQLIAGGIVALLGFSMFGVVWLQQKPVIPLCPPVITGLVHLILLVVLVLFAFALAQLCYRPKTQLPPANQHMAILPEDLGTKLSMKKVLFGKVYRAYAELADRNEDERLALRKGQNLFAYGVMLILLSIFLYLSGSVAYKIYPEAVNYEQIQFKC